jgi:hypothetical protein
MNISNIPELVRTGKLDSLLLLPVDSQFAVSTKQFGLDSILNAILGGVVVIVSLTQLNITPSVTSVLLYCVALAFGVAIHYSIMLALAAVSFWIIRAQGLVYGYFQFPADRALSGRHFSPDVPLCVWLDHPGNHCREYTGAPVDQAARRSVLAHVSSLRRRIRGAPDLAHFLEFRAASLLQRELVKTAPHSE